MKVRIPKDLIGPTFAVLGSLADVQGINDKECHESIFREGLEQVGGNWDTLKAFLLKAGLVEVTLDNNVLITRQGVNLSEALDQLILFEEAVAGVRLVPQAFVSNLN